MSVSRTHVEAALSSLPSDIVNNLLNDYAEIKHRFYLGHYQPSELNAGRFSESVLRLVEYLNTSNYTPFGTSLQSEAIIRSAESNTALADTFRFFIPRLCRVLLDVRNRRDVAHVGVDVNPNYSDSLLVTHGADWILTEIVRHYFSCPIEEAREIVANINEVQIPIIDEIDGFVRVQNTALDAKQKALVVLYYRQPEKVADSDLARWIRYKNLSRFKSNILSALDAEVLIHYQNGECVLTSKGKRYAEEQIDFALAL